MSFIKEQEKEIKRWQRKFKKRLKDKNLDSTIFKNNRKIIVKTKGYYQNYFKTSFIKESLILRNFSWAYRGFTEELFKETFNYWEALAELTDTPIIVMDKTNYIILKNYGYQELDEMNCRKEWEEVFGHLSDRWVVKEIEKGAIKKIADMNCEIKKCLEEMKEEHPTFTLEEAKPNYFKFERINYYHKGHKGTIEFNYKDKNFIVTEKEMNFESVVEKKEDIKGVLDELFHKVYIRKRTQNLFEQPKYHFNKMMNYIDGHSKTVQDQLYKCLSENYRPDQIETECARKIDELDLPELVENREKIVLLELLDVLFVIDRNHEKVVKCQTETEWYEQYRKVSNDVLNKTIEKGIKEMKDKKEKAG